MNEILCFDSYGDSIDKLVQWDTNLELYINWNYSETPIFHFSNANSQRILVIKGVINAEDKTAKANIPNILLQESSPLTVYVYLEKKSNESPTAHLKGETIYTFKIPVHAKEKPEDYEYTENTEYISWMEFEKNMQNRVDNLVTRGNTVVGEYETALAQIEGIRDIVISTADEVDSDKVYIDRVLSQIDAKLAETNKSEDNASSYAEEAKTQAEVSANQASLSQANVIKTDDNVALAKEYADKAQKYAEQAHEESDILYLEERVSRLEQVSGVNVVTLEEIKAYLGI